ncbi:hypothetical protein A2771_03630 [Candidatus Woesebacteria bacterium RIFCSPHIGHO2_01_FULL_38_26b]|uniref:Methyltransferase type 11 domain-containing protein n=1 Tax=Candidatus Woesebacteria bacterium RIFCSPHIGHO2_01_FULL_38_26b TaxID=1802491 RepID=A0A1F7Y1Q4_9BACT|nr:MAG: hypothetical protein A2771_03630 [Candidatus Woesebacteria bacterium RIFCSPHIGHO2_01_FULL_38_26b]
MIVKNPFLNDMHYHYKIAYEQIPSGNLKILDVGCGSGRFIGHLKMKSNKLYGYDVDLDKIKRAKKKYQYVRFSNIKLGISLPYNNNFFDVVTMFHVLEHVASEKNLISEIARITKKGSIFILSSPYKGLFAWADVANLRYLFPTLHKFLYTLFFGKSSYKDLYENVKEDLFGDCSPTLTSHKHYGEKEIRKLLERNFKIPKIYKFSLFNPFINIINVIDSFVRKRPLLQVSKYMAKIYSLDNKLMVGDLSYNFVLVAIRK